MGKERSKTKYIQEKTSVLAFTVMMLVSLVECLESVRLKQFMKKTEPEYSINEEVLFDCFAPYSVSFQTLFDEKIFCILCLILRPFM
jgi:hypothetical protein